MEKRFDEDDEDCPPPLEDMSDHLTALKSIKQNQVSRVSKQPDQEEEEVRLAPKKKEVSVIPPSDDSKPLPAKPAPQQ